MVDVALEGRHTASGASRWLTKIARAASTPRAFAMSLALVVIWAVAGPFFHYSNTWQLTLNTRMTILRFLMVLFIQHLQNRDRAAAHVKLDELIRASYDKAPGFGAHQQVGTSMTATHVRFTATKRIDA